ncbi:hypothetical protein XENORESO_011928, partial [Xenotaenia resolanae]
MWHLAAVHRTGALADRAGLHGTGQAHNACGCYSPDSQQGNTVPHTHLMYCGHTIPYCWCQTQTFSLHSVIIWKRVYPDNLLTFSNVLLTADCAAMFVKHYSKK